MPETKCGETRQYTYQCKEGLDRMRRALRQLAILAVILLLVSPGVGAAAPNAAAAEQSQEGSVLSAGSDLQTVTVLLDGLPVGFPISPFLEDGVTMVPLRALSEALGFTVTWHGEASPIKCEKDTKAIGLTLGETSVSVEQDGVTQTAVLPKPAHLQGNITVVPLRFFSETLGFDVDWDPVTYTADVTSPKSSMQVWGFYALGSLEYPSWEDLFGDKYPYPVVPGPTSPASNLTGAFLGWFAVNTEQGSIYSSGHPSGFAKPEGWEAVLLKMRMARSQPVAMFFADNAGGKLSALLANESLRDRLALNMATAVTVDFEGAAVDFEGLGATEETREKDAANLNAFYAALRRYLRGPKIYAVIPPLNSVYKGYDHKTLGEICDGVVIMAYGYEDPSSPSATAPWDKVDEAIRLESLVVPKEKIILGIPGYGTIYASTGGVTTVESRPAARDIVGYDAAVHVWNPSSATDVASWEKDGTSYKAFVENNESLQARAALARRHGISGIAVWRLGFLQPGWWEALREVVEPIR